MNPKSIDQIGFGRHGHNLALYWLAILFGYPNYFLENLQKFPTKTQVKIGIFIYLYALIYLGFCNLLQWLIGTLVNPMWKEANTGESILLIIIVTSVGLVLGLLVGAVIGLVDGFVSWVTFGLIWGIAMAWAGGFSIGTATLMQINWHNGIIIMFGTYWGFFFAIATGSTFRSIAVNGNRTFSGMSLELLLETTWGIFWAIALWYILSMKSSEVGRMFGVAFGTTTTILALRFFYVPLFLWFSLSKPLGHLYTMHPVAWDNLCILPFPALSNLLIAYSQYDISSCEREIERLINTYPTQRKAALKARTILLIQAAATSTELNKIHSVLSHLPVGKSGYLSEIPAARKMIFEINQTQVNLTATTLQTLREPKARILCEQIENFHSQAAGFHEPLASEFRKAATNWLALAQQQLLHIRILAEREAIAQVFRAGDPADRSREAFVPRYAVIEALEKQILLATGCPGIVLYGRRRMGKSTILGNLRGFLPDTVIPIFISMQDPQAFTSLSDLIRHSLQKIAAAWPNIGLAENFNADLPTFIRTLAFYNAQLFENNKRVLFAIDEYENLDRKLGEKVFPEDLLATIRESIQKHRNITWLFSGSHDITELKHAEWPSYLVSTRTIEVPMFTIDETRMLLTEPLKFAPENKDQVQRQRFEPSFWGENGIERIQEQAGGWPHLVQLIAETIVDVINDADQRQVDDTLFEAALNKAIVSGHNVLYQLLRGECTLPGEWEYLSAFRSRETQPLPGDEAIYVSLRRRLLMEEVNGEWRLRVPLMGRWLKQRG